MEQGFSTHLQTSKSKGVPHQTEWPFRVACRAKMARMSVVYTAIPYGSPICHFLCLCRGMDCNPSPARWHHVDIPLPFGTNPKTDTHKRKISQPPPKSNANTFVLVHFRCLCHSFVDLQFGMANAQYCAKRPYLYGRSSLPLKGAEGGWQSVFLIPIGPIPRTYPIGNARLVALLPSLPLLTRPHLRPTHPPPSIPSSPEGCGRLCRAVEVCAGLWKCVQGCGGVCRAVEVCAGLWRCVQGCGGVCRAVEVCAGLWTCVQGCGGVCRAVEGCAGLWKVVQGCGGVCRAVEVCAGLWKVVQGCGRLCRAVEVCAGLWRCVQGCGGVCRAVEVCAGLWRCVQGCGGVKQTNIALRVVLYNASLSDPPPLSTVLPAQ